VGSPSSRNTLRSGGFCLFSARGGSALRRKNPFGKLSVSKLPDVCKNRIELFRKFGNSSSLTLIRASAANFFTSSVVAMRHYSNENCRLNRYLTRVVRYGKQQLSH